MEGNLRKSHLEALLNGLENLLILLAAHKRYAQPLRPEPTRPSHTMKIRRGISWKIVVDGQVDSLNVDAPAKHVRSDADALVEFLEFLVAFDAAQPPQRSQRGFA